MVWYVYDVSPIDAGWEFLPTVKEFAAKILDEAGEGLTEESQYSLPQFLADWNEAQKQAKSKRWEGDHRTPPRVMMLPGENEFIYGFVIKQDNNGTTFVISPEQLPYLLIL